MTHTREYRTLYSFFLWHRNDTHKQIVPHILLYQLATIEKISRANKEGSIMSIELDIRRLILLAMPITPHLSEIMTETNQRPSRTPSRKLRRLLDTSSKAFKCR